MGEEVEFEITYAPITPHKLKSYKCVLKIVSGPSYDFFLFGDARQPGIDLNFTSYDFGPSFVMNQPISKTAYLEIVNNDDSAINIETNFEKQSHLDVQLAPGQVLLPSTKDKVEMLKVPIIFTPREMRKYHEVVKFNFNGVYFIDFEIKGEGIPMIVQLQDPEQHLVDFGIVGVGSTHDRTVNIINKSRRSINFTLDCATDYKRNNIEFSNEKHTLKPKQVMPIEVHFNPKSRMPDFWHDIMLNIENNES